MPASRQLVPSTTAALVSILRALPTLNWQRCAYDAVVYPFMANPGQSGHLTKNPKTRRIWARTESPGHGDNRPITETIAWLRRQSPDHGANRSTRVRNSTSAQSRRYESRYFSAREVVTRRKILCKVGDLSGTHKIANLFTTRRTSFPTGSVI